MFRLEFGHQKDAADPVLAVVFWNGIFNVIFHQRYDPRA